MSKKNAALVYILMMFVIVLTNAHFNYQDQLLLVVGDVDDSSARILHETLNKTTIDRVVHLYEAIDVNSIQYVRSYSIQLEDRPKVLHLTQLKQDRNYLVLFSEVTNYELKTNINELYSQSVVQFKTISTQRTNLKILALSCNRYFEDHDHTMLVQLVENESDRDGIVHLGDQVYADRVYHEIKRMNTTPSLHQVEELFRRVYRKTWGHGVMQNILRSGANWMLPDDHDFVNNLGMTHVNSNDPITQSLVQAGRKVYYEYQYQLIADLNDHKQDDDQIYYFKIMANTCWMFLDLRFQRAFHYDLNHPLLGTTQYEEIRRQINICADNTKQTVVFTAIPLLFNSQTVSILDYWFEGEQYSTHPLLINDTISLLDMLGDFKLNSSKSVYLVAGDVHQFQLAEVCKHTENNRSLCLPQMCTSGMTSGSTIVHNIFLYIIHTINRYYIPATAGDWKLHRRTNSDNNEIYQYLGKNYARMQVSDKTNLDWKGIIYTGNSLHIELMLWLFNVHQLLVIILFTIGIMILITRRVFL
jgi:hypothetical protein